MHYQSVHRLAGAKAREQNITGVGGVAHVKTSDSTISGRDVAIGEINRMGRMAPRNEMVLAAISASTVKGESCQ